MPHMTRRTILRALTPQRRTIVAIWALWAVVLIGFQAAAIERVRLVRPDAAVSWSANETQEFSNNGKIYLLEPLFNQQVAWDSEYYVGIAADGYDGALAGRATDPATGTVIPRNYSFFPGYPALMRVVATPLLLVGIARIPAVVIAGLIITLLGTLAGALALDELVRRKVAASKRNGDEAHALGIRAVVYLLLFPGAMFFAQIYTEGLFIGLAFGALAMAQRGRWLFAGLLAGAAALTRAHGVLTAIPLAIMWWQADGQVVLRAALRVAPARRARAVITAAAPLFACGLPVLVHLAWRFSSLGEGWALLQSFYFGRGYVSIVNSLGAWLNGASYALSQGHEAMFTYVLDRLSIVLALVASLALLRRREVALGAFSLALVLASGLSGDHQSTIRYMAIVPAIPIWLAHVGRRPWFDRAWSFACTLILGLLALLYSYDFWVA